MLPRVFRRAHGTAVLAVLQAFLLITTLVLTPAQAFAQANDPGAAPQAAAEQAGDAASQAAAPSLELRLFRPRLRMPEGRARLVSAFTCPVGPGAFGADRTPGTADDDCAAARVSWSIQDESVAHVSHARSPKTKVTGLSGSRNTVITARLGDLVARADIVVREPKVAPVAEIDDETRPPKDEPKAEPPADEPKAEPPADEPDADATEPPADEPKAEPPADEPKAEPSAQPTEPPADEPKAEPPADEPKAEPTAEPTDPPADEPTTPPTGNGGNNDVVQPEPSVAPAESPAGNNGSVEPSAAPSEEPAPAEDQAGSTRPRNNDSRVSGDPAAFDSPFEVAASVNVVVETRMANHTGQNNGTGGENCIRYSPTSGGSATSWVDANDNPATAWTSHGHQGQSCPGSLSISTQSAVGFSPTNATSIATSTAFLLGLMTHSNNPIQADDQYFPGQLGVRLFGGTADEVNLTFPWTLNETPNNASPDSNTANDDFTTFQDTTGSQSIHIGGIDYQLVLLGFRPNGTGQIGGTPPSCPASPSGSPVNQFRTVEGTQNYGCLYAELVPLRPLTIKKVAADGSTGANPAFDFSSTSTLTGSEWESKAWTLGRGDSYGPKALLPSKEDVVVTEGAESGWDLQGVVCKDGNGNAITGYTVNLAQRKVTLDSVPDPATSAEAPITCTFTNARQKATLTLVKTVVNNHGGTATKAQFQARIDGANVAWDTAVQLDPGAHTASEVMSVAGYTAGSWGGACAANGSVTLTAGQNATCTITNDDQAATLIVKKVVKNDNGGSKVASDFGFKVNGGTTVPFEADGQNELSVSAGTYSVTEPAVAGYATTYDSCSNLVIPNGGTATCTITNDDQAATLIVKKVVKNDNGGSKVASDFGFKVNGGTTVPFEADGQNELSVSAGTYSVTEPAVAGYATTYDSCSNLVIPNGGTATCTITNDDQAATLIVKKVVKNDNGGSKVASDFGFKVNGGTTVPFEADGQNELSVSAGTYSVTEPAVAGYATTYDSCSNLVIPNGGTATCTITNDDQAATLIVKKVVKNDNGGSKVASDFGFKVNGGTTVPFEADGQNELSVSAGTYSVTEPAVAGYATTYDSCSNLVIPNGGTATCTITNDDQAATLIVKKVVKNDNGGSKVASDFGFKVNGGTTVPFEADGQNELSVSAGTYSVTEPAVAGYATTYDSCSNLVIPNGGTATCTITNDDQAATLIVKKVVKNDNGGSKVASDFGFKVNGGTTVPFEADGQNELSVSAGTYSVTEPAVAGYATTYDTCSNLVIPNGGTATCTITNDDQAATLIVKKVVKNDNGGSKVASDFGFKVNGGTTVPFEADGQNELSVSAGTYSVTEPAVAGYATTYDTCSNLVIPNGGTATCTITNDDQQATITVIKVVQNGATGGTAQPDDFDLTLEGQAVSSGVAVPVVPGTYTAAETLLPGYAFNGFSGDCDARGDISVALGQHKTCTLTNTAQQATLTLVKSVSGGSATIADFQARLGGKDVAWSQAISLDPGTYRASEVMEVPDYVAGAWGGDCAVDGTVDVALGDALTCTITNYHAQLSIVKSAAPSFYDAAGDTILYTITATNTGQATLTGVDVSDALIDGLDSWQCSPATPATLAPGAAITCTATYTIKPADVSAGSVLNTACADSAETSEPVCDDETILRSELQITKAADVDTFDAAGDLIGYTITATNTGRATLHDVDVSDALIDGLGTWVCTPALVVDELAAGASITCTATYTVTQQDVAAGSVFNQACADSDETPEVCDDLDIPLARLEITKQASVSSYAAAGDPILYTVTAKNTGRATLSDVDVSDALIDGLGSWVCKVGDSVVSLPVGSLASGQSITCTATYVVTEADLTAGSVPNTACADSDETPEVCDDLDIPLARLEITKKASTGSFSAAGDEIRYTITATNTGKALLKDVDISDALIDGLDSWQCTPAIPASLAPGASITCTATYKITQQDVEAGWVYNQACADSDATPEVCDEVTLNVVAVELTKSVDRTVLDEPGGVFTYTLTIDNDSRVPVGITSLIDDNSALSPDFAAKCGSLIGTPLAADDGSDPGGADEASCTYTVERITAGVYVNVAEVTVTDKDGTKASDKDDATVEIIDVLPVIEVTKTAGSTVVYEPGDDVEFTYSVTNLSVEAVTITALVDDRFGPLSGDADCQVGTVLAASGQPGDSCAFSATFYVAGEPGTVHVNVFTAVAVDDDGDGNEASDDAQAEVEILPIQVFITKTPSKASAFKGEEVTFTVEFWHELPFDFYLVSLVDDVFGDLLDEANPDADIVANGCATADAGFVMEPNVRYTCSFTAKVHVEDEELDAHVNTVTITVTDADTSGPAPRLAAAEATAIVPIKSGGGSGGGGGGGDQPPTDMLVMTATPANGPLDGTTSWLLWIALTAMLIVSAGWVVRRQRLAEI